MSMAAAQVTPRSMLGFCHGTTPPAGAATGAGGASDDGDLATQLAALDAWAGGGPTASLPAPIPTPRLEVTRVA